MGLSTPVISESGRAAERVTPLAAVTLILPRKRKTYILGRTLYNGPRRGHSIGGGNLSQRGRCERAGRYNLDTLIAGHGEGFGIPKLLRLLSKECVKGRALLRVNPSTSSKCCK
jgi:hypothetical protein